MELFSLAMLLFLALCLFACYVAAPRIPALKGRRYLLLLAASLLWYGVCAGPCLIFPVLNTVILYFGGKRLEEIADEGKAKRKEAPDKEARKAIREATRSRRKRILILCLLLLLLPLLFFKYLPKPDTKNIQHLISKHIITQPFYNPLCFHILKKTYPLLLY